jgi:hypothetical protein
MAKRLSGSIIVMNIVILSAFLTLFSCQGTPKTEQFTADSSSCKIVYFGYHAHKDSIVKNGLYTKYAKDGQKLKKDGTSWV